MSKNLVTAKDKKDIKAIKNLLKIKNKLVTKETSIIFVSGRKFFFQARLGRIYDENQRIIGMAPNVFSAEKIITKFMHSSS
jgi:hypothetical protein